MTTVQMQDWDDGTVGFQSVRQVGAGEMRDAIVVHPTRAPGGSVVVEFATELHYGGGTTQRSESSIRLDPDQAATFARAMSAPRLGGIAAAPFEEIASGLRRELDRHVEQETELVRLLPGAYYMDPPDGGDVSLVEQFRRMAEDARKWREREPVDLREPYNAGEAVHFYGRPFHIAAFQYAGDLVELTLAAVK